MYARIFLARSNFGKMVTFGISPLRFAKNSKRAEFDTYAAALAAKRNDVDLAPRNADLRQIERLPTKTLHRHPLYPEMGLTRIG